MEPIMNTRKNFFNATSKAAVAVAAVAVNLVLATAVVGLFDGHSANDATVVAKVESISVIGKRVA
jgi:hypothetical protein